MIPLTNQARQSFRQLSRQYPELVEWFRQWEESELKVLPDVEATRQQLVSGRCKVLAELNKLLREAPGF